MTHPAGLRIGFGYDVHRLVKERPLILGGVTIPFEYGLLGHSDADVLAHAIGDALLGAAAMGDIGKHFPDTDETYRDVDSLLLLGEILKRIENAGYSIGNVDATVVAQQPRLAPHIDNMRARLSEALHLDTGALSVKATTSEGLGFAGREEGISAYAVVLLACPQV
ncbi:MAG: 2-C-methyl-D-erythritol 2,4-cyclodiphosphate synthase [Candidatus Latescibacteria bacterium]|nr:2-C-methyl-D-erythritol 2,4-cyclodiphosphate synthase [Candidatus Latescibacterota bacterium]